MHCKPIGAQETRAILTARKLLQSKFRDIENGLRGVLRFGLKVGKTTERTFATRISHLVAGHPGLEIIARMLLEAHAVLCASSMAWTSRCRKRLPTQSAATTGKITTYLPY